MKPGLPRPPSGKSNLLKQSVLNRAAEAELGEVGGRSSVLEDISQSQESSESGVDDIPEDEVEEADAVGDLPTASVSRAAPPVTRQESGGKYSPLAWEGYFDEALQVAIPGTSSVFNVYSAGKDGPVLFCIHGGGYTGLSFAPAAKQLASTCRVVAPDMRGHGRSTTDNDNDLSHETLCADVLAIIEAMYGSDPPPLVLIGHSMGGAVAIRTAAKRALRTLAGLVVIDVVEGTAMASLAFMQGVLSNRPKRFPSLDKAVEWTYRNGGIRNLESARVSVPSALEERAPGSFTWRANLEASEQYWEGWYSGLSDAFNSCPVPKLLLLAGTDRLDRPLTIAQMQGKFQMTVFRHAGHAIQEDEPEEFCASVGQFIHHNRIGSAGIEIFRLRRPVQR